MNKNSKIIGSIAIAGIVLSFLGFRHYKKKNNNIVTKTDEIIIDKRAPGSGFEGDVHNPKPVDKPIDPVVKDPNGFIPSCRPWTQEEIDLVNSGTARLRADFYDNRCTPFPINSGDGNLGGIREPIGPTKLPVDIGGGVVFIRENESLKML